MYGKRKWKINLICFVIIRFKRKMKNLINFLLDFKFKDIPPKEINEVNLVKENLIHYRRDLDSFGEDLRF